jgi:hypothetical protein
MQRAALTPALSRRERENIPRGCRRVEKGVGWSESRRLGRLEFWDVAVRDQRLPLPPGEGWGEGARFNPRDRWHEKIHGSKPFRQRPAHQMWRDASDGPREPVAKVRDRWLLTAFFP